MHRSTIARQGHRTFAARSSTVALVDQIVAHVGGPVRRPLLPGAVRGQLDGALRDVRFRELAVPGQGLDRMAIAIAGRKIHGRV
jgi:hypothetical protein